MIISEDTGDPPAQMTYEAELYLPENFFTPESKGKIVTSLNL